ncbi:hypothetical protein ASC66_09480 [Leifsonia sp. Root4]|nr:hypothetical protein ASC66_09480 [Leifsonia sp. Root4]
MVLYHLWPERITGGYVGVDVFFVISGFLITSHLLKEVERTGSISLTTFWARRVRRLLPAAFAVLATSLLAALIFLPKSLLQQTLVEIGASALYVQNWLLASNSIDYLGADNIPSLVQHFWSLSIEEQFYVAWPLVLLGALWLAFRAKSKLSRRQVVGATLSLVFLASLAYSVYETSVSQSSAYFVTPTRAWEFAAGGLIGLLPPILNRVSGRVQAARLAMSWLGLAMIVGSALLFTAASPFPGWIALIPVIGTAALIYAGDSKSVWSPQFVFAFKPAQLLGDISYAVYLWHWPLIVILPFVTGHHLTMTNKLLILVATLLLALATRRFIEEPVRLSTGRIRLRLPAFAFMTAGIVLIVGGAGLSSAQLQRQNQAFEEQVAMSIESGVGCFGASAMIASNDCDEPFAITDTINAEFAAADINWKRGVMADPGCVPRQDSQIKDCEFGDLDNPSHTVALIGDSHAHSLIDPLSAYGESQGWKVLMFAIPGCSALENDAPAAALPEPLTPEMAKIYDDCLSWGSEVLAEVKSDAGIDTVIFANRTSLYQIPPAQAASIWQDIASTGKSVLAVRDVPGMKDDRKAPQCVEANMSTYDPCVWKPTPAADFMVEATSMSTASLIDLHPYLCDETGCHSVIGGTIVYSDSNHMSYTFSQTLAPFLGAAISAAIDLPPVSATSTEALTD